FCIFFFFQAEDGIRDFHVTGVQTCALPISVIATLLGGNSSLKSIAGLNKSSVRVATTYTSPRTLDKLVFKPNELASGAKLTSSEIGRASCRERGSVWGADE